MILLVVLIGLTGCTTTDVKKESAAYNSILIEMIPFTPSIPSLPVLNWSYEDNKYYLNERDVDQLLNYGENELPFYRFEMDNFNKQLELIIDGIINK